MILWPVFDLLALCPVLLIHQKNFVGQNKELKSNVQDNQNFNTSIEEEEALEQSLSTEKQEEHISAPADPVVGSKEGSSLKSNYEF
jgi:hypothetical protein